MEKVCAKCGLRFQCGADTPQVVESYYGPPTKTLSDSGEAEITLRYWPCLKKLQPRKKYGSLKDAEDQAKQFMQQEIGQQALLELTQVNCGQGFAEPQTFAGAGWKELECGGVEHKMSQLLFEFL